MGSSIFSSDKRVHLTLLTALASIGIFMLVNVGIYLYDAAKKDGIRAENIFWEKKINPGEKYDIVFLGDSRCLTGLVPEIFSKILQKSSFNASFAGGGLNSFVFTHTEKNILSNNSPVRCIVLSITPLAMSKKARANENYHSIVKRMQANSTLYDRICNIVFRRVNSKESARIFGERKDRLVFHSDGYLECMEKVKEKVQKRNINGYREYFRTMEFAPESLQEILLYTAKWHKENILVFAFRPPTTPGMEALENEMGKCDFSIVKTMFESVGGVYLDVPEREKYNAYDASHLASGESRKLSKVLAEKIHAHIRKKLQ